MGIPVAIYVHIHLAVTRDRAKEIGRREAKGRFVSTSAWTIFSKTRTVPAPISGVRCTIPWQYICGKRVEYHLPEVDSL
jgi:hypothetical protein